MRAFGGRRHLQGRDWRRALQATGAGTFASAAAINLGQSFTISAMVYLPAYGSTVAIWNCASGAGVRFTITTTGAMSLNNATDAAQVTPAAVVPLATWCKVEVSFDGPTRLTTFRVDGETVQSAAMAGTTAWTYTVANAMALPLGTRTTRLQAWRRVLTQAESRADFYSWTGPTPDVSFPLNNTEVSTTVMPGTDSGVALGNASTTNVIWTDDVPSRPVRGSWPFGYGIAAWATPDGTSTLQIDTRTLMSAATMAALQAADRIVLGHWVRFQGAQTQSFRSLYLELASAGIGPAIRFDCTTAAGEIRPQINGRLTTSAGAASAIPATPVNIAQRVAGRWAHIAAVIDYVASTVTLYLDGLPLIAPEAFTPTGRYHSDPVDGAEDIMAGTFLAAVTGSVFVRTIQTDHIVAAQAASVDTARELRRLVLTGVEMSGTVYRNTLTEGVGLTSTEAKGQTVLLTRDGGQGGAAGTAAAASWRAINAP